MSTNDCPEMAPSYVQSRTLRSRAPPAADKVGQNQATDIFPARLALVQSLQMPGIVQGTDAASRPCCLKDM